MRQLLMTALLIATVVALYVSFAGGEEGANGQISSSGSAMADRISGISP